MAAIPRCAESRALSVTVTVTVAWDRTQIEGPGMLGVPPGSGGRQVTETGVFLQEPPSQRDPAPGVPSHERDILRA
jgi:hypothetical protein